MDIKEEIHSLIDQIAQKLVDSVPAYKIEYTNDEHHGDVSVNIAFVLARELKKSPNDIAQSIVLEVEKEKPSSVAKIEVVSGYINFYLSKEFFISQLYKVLSMQEEVAVAGKSKGKKVVVEYTDPNPFKEFHIGHLYNNAVGESVSRLFEAKGAQVVRVNYQGDVGMHVAKAIYGLSLVIPNLFRDPNEMLKRVQHDTLAKKVKLLGEAYALGAKAYEDPSDSEKVKQEIQSINKAVYEKDPSILELWEKGRAWSLEYFETIYKRLGTKFDDYYFESEVGIIGTKLVKEYQLKGVFEESEGAVIFPGEKYNLHNRVFINSLGLPTYEAKELGLNKKKYEDYSFDVSVIVTGNEINEYFKVLFAAMEQVIPEVAQKTKHIGHGMVKLPEGKMSSRTGNILSGEWLLDEAKKRICGQFSEMDEKTAEMVAVGAVKYALLKSSIGRNIEFDFDTSISFEGNSGPYLQYTYVRTRSVLTKKCHSGLDPESTSEEILKQVQDDKKRAQNDNITSEELALLRSVVRFPEVVGEAADNLSPHLLCNYLYDVSQKFNYFYQKHKIIGSQQEEFRIRLTQATGIVIKQGLSLLGIKAPERM